jgi:hypothetical protein
LLESRALKPLRTQKVLDDLVASGGIVVEVEAVSSVWLDVRREVGGVDVGEVHLRLGLERRSDATSGSTVAAAVRKVGV